MPRNFLLAGLQAIWPQSLVVAILTSWHLDTHYIISTNGFEDHVPTKLGIRQGCTGAPTLWSIAMWHLLQHAHAKLGST